MYVCLCWQVVALEGSAVRKDPHRFHSDHAEALSWEGIENIEGAWRLEGALGGVFAAPRRGRYPLLPRRFACMASCRSIRVAGCVRGRPPLLSVCHVLVEGAL